MIFNAEADLWVPDETVKTDRCWRFIKRNVADLETGISYVKRRSVALQAGGHIGIFPNYLAKQFDRVYTFEPDPSLFPCLQRNAAPNVVPIYSALSSKTGTGQFKSNVGGVGRIDLAGEFTVKTIAWDEMDVDVNFIHLDVEGHEVEALKGAAQMIEAVSPVLQLEILPRFKDEIYDYVQSIGYVLANDSRRDHVFVRVRK